MTRNTITLSLNKNVAHLIARCLFDMTTKDNLITKGHIFELQQVALDIEKKLQFLEDANQ